MARSHPACARNGFLFHCDHEANGTNIAGKVTSGPAALAVIDPPHITGQPLSRTNIAWTTATFGVVATGTAPLSYQWLKGIKPDFTAEKFDPDSDQRVGSGCRHL